MKSRFNFRTQISDRQPRLVYPGCIRTCSDYISGLDLSFPEELALEDSLMSRDEKQKLTWFRDSPGIRELIRFKEVIRTEEAFELKG